MSRVKIELPESLPFVTELEVRIGDVNYGRHLGNDAVLGLLHEARLRFLKQNGFTEENAGGAAMIMLDAVIVYAAQAFHGDRLRAEVGAGDFGACGCDFYYRLTRIADGREIARAKTALAFFDYAAHRIARMPAEFKARLATPA
ncbi:MAG TPA: thioesterase family protein [Kiritimatiellia bacterium]|nr:thioesterase family protein [Kiritimatiellia bacterium]HRZ12975.1 thioesterase family protein [Kiritimatiellia bacterium]HSA18415.1 thioesterase family protein [Kiritimatiellia bacterium]